MGAHILVYFCFGVGGIHLCIKLFHFLYNNAVLHFAIRANSFFFFKKIQLRSEPDVLQIMQNQFKFIKKLAVLDRGMFPNVCNLLQLHHEAPIALERPD